MANFVTKAWNALTRRDLASKASRGTVTGYVLGAPQQYGQPIMTEGDAYGQITPERMREIVMKSPTASACIHAIIDFCINVPIEVQNIDSAKPVNIYQASIVRELLRNPNPDDTGRKFLKKLYKDLLTYGYAAVEIERNAAGLPANLYIVDAGRIKVDFDEHGKILGYNMLNARGMPITTADGVHAWLPDNIIWLQLDPESRSPYGISRIVELYATAVIETLMLHFIGQRFTDSNIPFGTMDLGDLSNDELQFAVDKWNEQAEKTGGHRIVMSNSRGGAKWIPFGYHLKDLEATTLLDTIQSRMMGILGVTENELGESQNINKANGYNLSFTFKKRAVEPVLGEVCDSLTTFLLHKQLAFSDLKLFYQEIDSRDELIESQIWDLLEKMGVVSVNHVRNQKGLPNTPGGDEPCIWTGSAWIPVSMIHSFAQAQLEAVQLMNAQVRLSMLMMATQPQQGQDGQSPSVGAHLDQPNLRAIQLPERFVGQDTKGSETPQLKLPRPPKPGAQTASSGAKRDGPAHARRSQGMDK